jgi:hypothetical protein
MIHANQRMFYKSGSLAPIAMLVDDLWISQAGLSKIALKWMVEQAKGFGLASIPRQKKLFCPPMTRDYVAPEFATRWIIHAGSQSYVASNPNVHQSVVDRKNRVPSYRPPNLPTAFTVAQ